ncbi:MAG: double-cubane-cluster-containing anaerobic reductase [bacterium]
MDPNACGSDHRPSSGSATSAPSSEVNPLNRFDRMIPHALAFVKEAKARGRMIAGIFCEYTPREIFYAAGMVPVCMCGGQEATIAEAEKELPANLCPLIKSSYGHALLRSNPFLEMADLLAAETTCDGKKKMYELLGRARPVFVLELPQKPDESAAFVHWLREIESLKRRVEELTGNTITSENLAAAIARLNEERRLRREIAYLAAEDPPLLSGGEILNLKSIVSLIPADLDAYREVIAWARRRPSPYAGRPRLLLTGVPHPHGAEKVMKVIEQAGGVVVAQENCTGLKPIRDDMPLNGNPLESLARYYFDMPCSCLTPNRGRIELLGRLIHDFRPWGIIDLAWQACHTYNLESTLIRQAARERWNLPYLKLETDYSPSDTAHLRVRVEAFLELCVSSRKYASSRI